jgi:hypothetical protein
VTEFLTACTASVVCSPNGPGTPFSNGWLALFDCLRVVCVLTCLATLAVTARAYGCAQVAGQRARVIALMLFMLQAITTETEHLGDYASARLLFNLAAAVWALYGMWQMRQEYPAERRHHRDDSPPAG